MAGKCIATYNGSETNGKEMVTIINFFIGKNLTPNQIAAIIGCIQKSSSFKTNTEVTDKNKKKTIGICLWDEDRGNKLKEYAKQNNKEWTDLTLQLDYLWSELNSSYKSNLLDWLTSNQNASIKDVVSKWEQVFEGCTDKKGCGTKQKTKNAEAASKFYNKYAKDECEEGSDVSDNDNDEANSSGSDGSSATGESTGIQTDVSKPSVSCGIQINAVSSGGSTDSGGSGDDTPTAGATNTTDYNGKTLTLRLEREDFSCERTFGSLYDTTDGKKQFICYTVEDRVRYKGNKCSKVAEQTAIPYGTYSFSLASAGAAKKCSGSVDKSCRYYYAADYKKYSKYNGKMALLSGVNNDGCSFTQILIHASTNNDRADENNSAGCIIVGLNKNGTYLSGAQDAYYKLYEDYILPAAEAGSKMQIEIPRLHQDKDQNC